MANVVIEVATEFTGKKAFKEADTATQKLTRNVKKLAGAVGIAYGASAIVAYSKRSVKAFAQDEAAAQFCLARLCHSHGRSRSMRTPFGHR